MISFISSFLKDPQHKPARIESDETRLTVYVWKQCATGFTEDGIALKKGISFGHVALQTYSGADRSKIDPLHANVLNGRGGYYMSFWPGTCKEENRNFPSLCQREDSHFHTEREDPIKDNNKNKLRKFEVFNLYTLDIRKINSTFEELTKDPCWASFGSGAFAKYGELNCTGMSLALLNTGGIFKLTSGPSMALSRWLPSAFFEIGSIMLIDILFIIRSIAISQLFFSENSLHSHLEKRNEFLNQLSFCMKAVEVIQKLPENDYLKNIADGKIVKRVIDFHKDSSTRVEKIDGLNKIIIGIFANFKPLFSLTCQIVLRRLFRKLLTTTATPDNIAQLVKEAEDNELHKSKPISAKLKFLYLVSFIGVIILKYKVSPEKRVELFKLVKNMYFPSS